jgi:Protein of unknown function (DUF2829)
MNIIGNPKYLHIGTKAVLAHLMTKLQYCDYRGWKVPENEDESEQGYLVEYLDGGKSNHPQHVGYISWSPKDVFEQSYKSSGSLSFGYAVELLKSGKKVARSGWNGKGMFLYYVPENKYPAARNTLNTLDGLFDDNLVPYGAYIAMKTAQNNVVPWLASQTDVLADDWEIIS